MKCPLCDSEVDNSRPLKSFNEYKLYSCIKCKNGFWWPLRGQKAEDYVKDDFKAYEQRHTMPSGIAENHKKFFGNIGLKGGKLLDVGCSDGSFVSAAKERFDAYGIDFDKKAIEAARRFDVDNVYVMDIRDMSRKFGKFDVVTFFEVLEHQSEPQKFMDSVKKVLTKSGWIAGSIPFHERIEPVSRLDYPPHHFLLFTVPGLKTFLESNGFHEVSIIVFSFNEADLLRASSGLSGTKLRKILNIDESISKNSFKYKVYTFARAIKPLINLPFRVFSLKKNNKKAPNSSTSKTIYFQAKFSVDD